MTIISAPTTLALGQDETNDLGITPTEDQTLIAGVTRDTSILHRADAAAATPQVLLLDGVDRKVANLTIDGNYAGNTGTQYGIYQEGGSVTYENIHVKNPRTANIAVGAGRAKFDRVYSADDEFGVTANVNVIAADVSTRHVNCTYAQNRWVLAGTAGRTISGDSVHENCEYLSCVITAKSPGEVHMFRDCTFKAQFTWQLEDAAVYLRDCANTSGDNSIFYYPRLLTLNNYNTNGGQVRVLFQTAFNVPMSGEPMKVVLANMTDITTPYYFFGAGNIHVADGSNVVINCAAASGGNTGITIRYKGVSYVVTTGTWTSADYD